MGGAPPGVGGGGGAGGGGVAVGGGGEKRGGFCRCGERGVFVCGGKYLLCVAGLRYGSTLVPFSADDKEVMKVPSAKCLKVLGFTETQNMPRHHFLGDSTLVIVAEKADQVICFVAFSHIKVCCRLH
ncbi:hypothetical protein LSAT2_027495 [Lamellibrachia satsuma]|nr:hypothetical protein LSAT2_027495 [Lamellibrachia satsuma]